MENNKFFCTGCEECVDFLDDWGTNGVMLCEECNQNYHNTTGSCSLSCCLGGGCDHSC